MARPRLHSTPADRQSAYTARLRLIRITVPARTAETLDGISARIDASRRELTAAMLSWAMAQPDVLRAGHGFRGSFDARIDGPTARIDVQLPAGSELSGPEAAALIQLALAGRQWSRFGLNWAA